MKISKRMVDVNETHTVGICSMNIYPSGPLMAGAVIGSPFLSDFYQVYDMTRNQMGLVPSLFTNPYNDDGLYTSSKTENTRIKKERPILTWISFAVFFIVFFIRNVIMHHAEYFRDAFDEDNNTPKQKVDLWGYENILPPPAPDSYEPLAQEEPEVKPKEEGDEDGEDK